MATSHAASMRPPRPACWTWSTTRSRPVGVSAAPVPCSSPTRSELTAGSPAGPEAISSIVLRAGPRCTGSSPEEVEHILALFEEWGETTGRTRKFAHRGPYLGDRSGSHPRACAEPFSC